MATKKRKGRSTTPPQIIEKRQTLSTPKKDAMFATMIRNLEVFEAVKPHVTTKDLAEIRFYFGEIWACVCTFFTEYGELPPYKLLKFDLEEAIAHSRGRLNATEIDDMMLFIRRAWRDTGPFGNLLTDTARAYAIRLFKSFKEEQVAGRLSEAMTRTNNRLPVDLAAMLQSNQLELAETAILDAQTVAEVFPDGWDEESLARTIPTGIVSLDRFMSGGPRAGETFLFMGPYGSCKTVLAVQGASESARICEASTYSSNNTENKIYKSVFVSYEADIKEFRERVLAYVAQITRTRLATGIQNMKELRGETDDPQPYELVEFASQIANGTPFLSEKARVANAVRLFNQHAIFLDLSRADESNPTRGTGGVAEIVAYLRAEQRRTPGLVIGSVWVDHLAAMASNIVMGNPDMEREDLRHVLKNLPLQFKNQIAKTFDTYVGLLAQLSGKANGRGPTSAVHHTEGDECAAIAMFTDTAIQTGTPTQDAEALCVWYCTKHRREPAQGQQVIRIDGAFNRVLDVSSRYVIDTQSRRILSIAEANTMADVVQVQQSPQRNLPVPTLPGRQVNERRGPSNNGASG